MNSLPPPSPLVRLATTLEALPAYLFSFVIGLLVAVLTDPILTALLIGSVALGLATTALIAFVVFFFVYVLIRTINTVANAIGNGLHQVSAPLRQPSYKSTTDSNE